MHLAKLSIRNFRNFSAVDIPLAGNVVLLGENRVGKSNLLFAVRLVLDPTLSDSARLLKLSDFWDGCDLTQSPQIEVHLDFADFDNDDALVALLTDFRTAGDPKVAQLSYVYRRKSLDGGAPQSGEDYEFIVYGGGDESRPVPNRVRRRMALDMLDALRDAEGQLASWRSSPLRPLLEDAIASVSQTERYRSILPPNGSSRSRRRSGLRPDCRNRRSKRRHGGSSDAQEATTRAVTAGKLPRPSLMRVSRALHSATGPACSSSSAW